MDAAVHATGSAMLAPAYSPHRADTMKTTSTLAAFFILACLGACQSTPVRVPASTSVAITGLSDASDGPLGLDVDNRAGSVKVQIDRGLDSPQVSASTTNSRGDRYRAPWAAADLDTSGPHPVLRVLAAPPDGRGAILTDLVIRLPECAGVRIRNRVGPVWVQGVRGAVDVQNGSEVDAGGSIAVVFGAPACDPILLRSGGGPIALDLPRRSTGAVNAMARTGVVTILGSPARLSAVGAHHGSWYGVINDGENPVTLDTERGDITIRVLP